MCTGPIKHSEEEIDNMKDIDDEIPEDDYSEDTDNDTSPVDEHNSFVTSTPQKTEFQCDECVNKSQCTDCFVRQFTATGQLTPTRKPKVHFRD